jgi:hypothetical protein
MSYGLRFLIILWNILGLISVSTKTPFTRSWLLKGDKLIVDLNFFISNHNFKETPSS